MHYVLRKVFSLTTTVLFVAIVVIQVSCTHETGLLADGGDNGGVDPGGNTPPGCTTDGKVCFESSVLPIFISSCAKSGCHDAQSHEEDFVLNSYANIVKRGIVPGKASESKLYRVLNATGEDQMPPDGPLTKAQKDSIALWINQGALNTTDCNCFCDVAKFTYSGEVQPTIARNCVGCHKPGNLSGNVDLSNFAAVKAQAISGALFGSISHAKGFTPMPPSGKLSSCEIDQVREWIEAGTPQN